MYTRHFKRKKHLEFLRSKEGVEHSENNEENRRDHSNSSHEGTNGKEEEPEKAMNTSDVIDSVKTKDNQYDSEEETNEHSSDSESENSDSSNEKENQLSTEPEIVRNFECECGAYIQDTTSSRKSHSIGNRHQRYMKRAHLDTQITQVMSSRLATTPLIATTALSDEIFAFWKSVAPSKEELSSRREFATFLQRKFLSNFPDCKILIFGSSQTGLCDANSDIDFTMTYTLPDGTLPDEVAVLRTCQKILRKIGAQRMCVIADARVPILKHLGSSR
jgi:hypothetical protein